MSEQSERAGSGRAKRWTEAEAREALREFRESGLSATAFASRKGISPTRFPYWTYPFGLTRHGRDQRGGLKMLGDGELRQAAKARRVGRRWRAASAAT
jgi:hypothetical protein